MAIVIRLVRIALGLGAFGLSLLAVIAFLGFAVPVFDVFNHLQFLIFPGLLVAMIVVVPLLGANRWRQFLLAATATGLFFSALIVVPDAVASLQPRPPLPTDGRPVIKMMTHNLFGLNYDMPRVARIIATENPDIVALQEYFGEQSGELDPLLSAQYPYSVHCRGGKRANIALYSRLPFVQVDDHACPDDAYGETRSGHIIATFTLKDGTRFSVMTTHLDWPAPKMARQAEQFETLREAIAKLDTPLILAGDFNSTSWSYALRDFTAAAGLTRQDHNIFTFPMRFYIAGWRDTWPPFLPLDHVMTRGPVTVYDLHAGPATGSDHLPLIFTFSVGSGPA
jgi:endonuclease/exonuclease/phosphatase (EEP) superfamily protein YafD